MSGNIAIGSRAIETSPPSTVTIAMTMATVGRRTKKAEIISALRPMPPRGSAARSCRCDDRAGTNQRRIDDHAGARLESLRDDPTVARLLTEGDGLHLDLVVCPDDANLRHALQLAHRALRHQERIPRHCRGRSHAPVLAGPQHAIRIRERRTDADGAGRGVDLPIGGEKRSGLRIVRSVGQPQVQRRPGVPEALGGNRAVDLARDAEVLVLAEREVRADWIHLRHRREQRRRTDLVTHLRRGDRGDAVHERPDLREIEIQPRGLHGGLCRLHRRLRREIGLNVVVELALRNRTRIRERRIARDVALGLSELRLCLRELSFGLGERRLERARIDLEEYVAFADDSALAIRACDEIAADLRANLRVDQPVERRHPLARDLDRLGGQLNDGHRRRRRRRRVRVGAAAGDDERQDCRRDEQHHGGRSRGPDGIHRRVRAPRGN